MISLPMYLFPENAEATAALGRAVAESLGRRGIRARWTEVPSAHKALVRHWKQPSLVLSQSCGLPLIEDLAAWVEPVGTLVWRGVTDAQGRYRSVVVARRDGWSGAVRPAVNGIHSLSGWASLGVYLAGGGAVQPPLLTGSHAASVEAVHSRHADVAAIDGVTWSLLSRYGRTRGLTVVGQGPVLPSLPLITSRNGGIPVETIRAAIGEALGSSARQAKEALGIECVLPQRWDDFATVPELVRAAETVLPRRRA